MRLEGEERAQKQRKGSRQGLGMEGDVKKLRRRREGQLMLQWR